MGQKVSRRGTAEKKERKVQVEQGRERGRESCKINHCIFKKHYMKTEESCEMRNVIWAPKLKKLISHKKRGEKHQNQIPYKVKSRRDRMKGLTPLIQSTAERQSPKTDALTTGGDDTRHGSTSAGMGKRKRGGRTPSGNEGKQIWRENCSGTQEPINAGEAGLGEQKVQGRELRRARHRGKARVLRTGLEPTHGGRASQGESRRGDSKVPQTVT